MPTAPLAPLADLLWLEDYPAAESLIRQALTSAPADVRFSLQLLLARVLLAQERYEEADALLALLRTKGPLCPTRPQGAEHQPLLEMGDERGSCLPREVHVLHARVLAARGQYEEALAAYRVYLQDEQAPLAWEAYASIARLHREREEPADALAAYERAVRYAPISEQPALQREEAAYLATLGRLDEALDLYTAVLARADLTPALRARAWLERGQIYAQQEQAQEAYEDWRRAVEEAVHTAGGQQPAQVERSAIPYAYQALVLLLAAGEQVDDYTRGVVDVEAGAYGPATTALVRYLETVEPHWGDGHAYLARALSALGRTAGAIEQWRVLIDTHPECPCWGEAWFALARVYRQSGQDARARALMRELAQHPKAGIALRERARLYVADQFLGEGNFVAAVREYASLAYDAQTPQVRNRAALLTAILSLPERPDIAIQTLEQALSYPLHPNWGPVLRYWLGQAYLDGGERSRAIAIWQELAAERPLSYYAFRAAQRLQRLGEPVPPWTPFIAADSPLQPWLPAPLQVETLVSRYPVPQDVADALRRAAALESAGWEDRGYRLYGTILARLSEPSVLLAVGEFLQTRGYVNLGIRAGLAALDASGQDLRQASPAHWRLLYPLPARRYVQALADEYALDPALLYALMRQESHFATRATSVAGARGLMQLIPSTARDVARSLGLDVQDEVALYRPTLNLRLGTYFLAYNLRRFEGHVYAALAGYNAGPGNAAHWLQRFGKDPDRLLELIPVLETRTYLREVLRQWYIYQAILAQE